MNLAEAIRRKKSKRLAPIIAEVKRLIPRLAERGRPTDWRDAGELARLYKEGGACGISLVAERRHFGGQPEVDIPAILRSVDLPLLIKDFILEEGEVDFYARLVGEERGRISLLVLAHRLGERLVSLLDYIARKGMQALVETRGIQDLPLLERLPKIPSLIGLNNKDIDNLERGDDILQINEELVQKYRKVIGNALLISESAHRSPEDVRFSLQAGADAILAGTPFMLSPNPAAEVRKFVLALGGKWSGL